MVRERRQRQVLRLDKRDLQPESAESKNNTTTYINLGDLEQLKELEKLKDLDVLKKLGSGTYEVQSGDMQDNNEIKTSTDFSGV